MAAPPPPPPLEREGVRANCSARVATKLPFQNFAKDEIFFFLQNYLKFCKIERKLQEICKTKIFVTTLFPSPPCTLLIYEPSPSPCSLHALTAGVSSGGGGGGGEPRHAYLPLFTNYRTNTTASTWGPRRQRTFSILTHSFSLTVALG